MVRYKTNNLPDSEGCFLPGILIISLTSAEPTVQPSSWEQVGAWCWPAARPSYLHQASGLANWPQSCFCRCISVFCCCWFWAKYWGQPRGQHGGRRGAATAILPADESTAAYRLQTSRIHAEPLVRVSAADGAGSAVPRLVCTNNGRGDPVNTTAATTQTERSRETRARARPAPHFPENGG